MGLSIAELQARANEAIERDMKIYEPERDDYHSKQKQKRDKVERIGTIRTAVNLLDEAIENFADKKEMKNNELRKQTFDSFSRVGVENSVIRSLMTIAAQRISIFDPVSKEQHNGSWDNFDAVVVFQLVRASLVHFHKTDEFDIEHLRKVIKKQSLKSFKYKIDDELDTKEDDKLLKEKRENDLQEQKEYEARIKERDFKLKLDKALKIKKRIDEENELLAWLEQHQKENKCVA